MYECIIGAIREELQATRQRAAVAEGAARAAEERVRDSMCHSRDRFAAMEQEAKHLAQVGRPASNTGCQAASYAGRVA